MADNKSREGKRSLGTLTVDVDVSDALKGLKAVQREARKATAALKDLETVQSETSKPLLTIELDSLDSVPRLFYKGEEVKDKTDVEFYWTTKTDKPGEVGFTVKYYEFDKHGIPTHMMIGDGRLQ